MDFGAYQRGVKATDKRKKMLVSLAGLVGEVGSIVSAYKNRGLLASHPPSLRRELEEELGDALWYLTSVASSFRLSLNQIAKQNLQKARWLNEEGARTTFDKGYPADERFPRQFKVDFTEKELGKRVLVKVSVAGVTVGDHLTDNSYDKDGYRYHDVFHLAYAAILGWSPVIRALLKRKRKSNPRVDEIEDGARAIAVEEAISIFVFNHAMAHNFFANPNSIGFSLLRKVQDIGGNLQIKNCTAKQWGRAIELGYTVFRELKANHGGTVCIDLDKRDIWYAAKPKRSSNVRKNGRAKRR